jgi:hypothetical protein
MWDPGYAYQWEASRGDTYLAWQRQFVSAAHKHDELAGARMGGPPDPKGWELDGRTLGREVSYAGYPALLVARLAPNGRLDGLALGYTIAHPDVDVGSQQKGLTISATPEATAVLIREAVRRTFQSEGFNAVDWREEAHADVEHFVTPDQRERTLVVKNKRPGQLALVMAAIPDAQAHATRV